MPLGLYTRTGQAVCGTIVALGHPPRTNDWQVVVRQTNGQPATFLVPNHYNLSPDFRLGSVYCYDLVNGRPSDTPLIVSRAKFNALYGSATAIELDPVTGEIVWPTAKTSR